MKDFFYKPLKVNEKEENILVWGCLHYGHDPTSWEVPLWKMRGYDSVISHNIGIKRNWESKANHNTVGFLLGDTIFGMNAEYRLKALFEELSFKALYVMPGNHQAGWKQLFEASEDGVLHLNSEKKVFFVPNYLECVINGQSVVMSHYPVASWNGQSKGSIMIHSHCHGNLYHSEVGKSLYKAKIIDVGVEKCPAPLNFREVRKIFNDRENVSFDHHDNKTQNPF
jgi:calcineurin-like phosphoesterase family protein